MKKKISTVIKKTKKKDDNKKDKRDKARTKTKAKSLDKFQKEKDNITNKFTLKDEDGNEKNYSFHRKAGDH